MKDKIHLFLDIDGVLSTVKQFNLTNQSKTWIHGDYLNGDGIYPFDDKCVEVLNEILWQFDLAIVISSDWRHYLSLKQLQEIFIINGVIQTPVDITPNSLISISHIESNRCGDIWEFVEENKINKWVAIDDLNLLSGKKPLPENNFIRCYTEFEGIKQTGLKQKIINKLNNYIT
jgi:hypothetical protein